MSQLYCIKIQYQLDDHVDVCCEVAHTRNSSLCTTTHEIEIFLVDLDGVASAQSSKSTLCLLPDASWACTPKDWEPGRAACFTRGRSLAWKSTGCTAARRRYARLAWTARSNHESTGARGQAPTPVPPLPTPAETPSHHPWQSS